MAAETKAQHSAGPWRYRRDRVGCITIDVENADGSSITLAEAKNMYGYRPHWEVEANARLIAAAPDLLHWLEAIIEEAADVDDHDGRLAHVSFGTIAQAMIAIAKARGEA